jgi:hypothetical protein
MPNWHPMVTCAIAPVIVPRRTTGVLEKIDLAEHQDVISNESVAGQAEIICGA